MGYIKTLPLVRFNITNATKTSLNFEDRKLVATVLENSTSKIFLAVLRATGSYLSEPLQYTVLNPHGKLPWFHRLESCRPPEFRLTGRNRMSMMWLWRSETWGILHVWMSLMLRVYIDDINDNAPEISNLPHSLKISDETWTRGCSLSSASNRQWLWWEWIHTIFTGGRFQSLQNRPLSWRCVATETFRLWICK